jgi:carbamoyl-phosphate synthase small subunit
MSKRAILVLEDGSIYEGDLFGADKTVYGEVVFSTSMAGYQEMLTDPSLAGQILVATFPLIGNYGINADDFESDRIWARGLVVRENCPSPSHYLANKNLDEFLKEYDTPGISGLDTREITRKLRNYGVMMGMITTSLTPSQALNELGRVPPYDSTDFVREVTTNHIYSLDDGGSRPLIVVLDLGVKRNILHLLRQFRCKVIVVPSTTDASDILSLNPDGIVLSSGPSNPENLDYLLDTIRRLIGQKPILGICLGHQLVARALGAQTFKLKFGHRGANHPVIDLKTRKVYINAQNHGYAVDSDSLKGGLEVSHVNVNDGTVEGLSHRDYPVLCIQYHAEASPGPLDSTYIFQEFMEMLKNV